MAQCFHSDHPRFHSHCRCFGVGHSSEQCTYVRFLGHYLDNFANFGSPGSSECQENVYTIIETCAELNVPLANARRSYNNKQVKSSLKGIGNAHMYVQYIVESRNLMLDNSASGFISGIWSAIHLGGGGCTLQASWWCALCPVHALMTYVTSHGNQPGPFLHPLHWQRPISSTWFIWTPR